MLDPAISSFSIATASRWTCLPAIRIFHHNMGQALVHQKKRVTKGEAGVGDWASGDEAHRAEVIARHQARSQRMRENTGCQ